MKRNIFFLLSLCIVLFSCSGDNDDPIKEIEKPPVETEEPFITLKKSNIDFTNEGGSEGVLIESNVTWTTKSSASWCTVTPSSGNKSTESITLSAPANKDYDNRSCTVTLEGGGITKTITVNQGENLGLLITQDRYELGNEESTIKVEVKANVEFEVKINDAWITQVETRGLTTSEIEFKISENDTYSNREGSITIKQKDGEMESTITVYQLQEDALILSEKDFDLSSKAQSIEVELKTNIEYEVIIPETAKNWVSYIKTRALRTEAIVLEIDENKDYEIRSTVVYIKSKKFNLLKTLTISQDAASMTDILEKEKLIIKQFIEDNNLIILDTYPEENVFKPNEFFLDPSGLYYHVINPGNDRKIKNGEEFYIRFKGLKYISSKDTTTYSNINSLQPEVLVYGNTSTYASAGWVTPLKNVGDRAKVKLIVPFNIGLPRDQQSYKTAYYEELSYRFEN